MAPRLSGQTSIFGVVFFVSKSLLGIERQKKLEKFAILTQKPRSHARILKYRTWPIGYFKTRDVIRGCGRKNSSPERFERTLPCLIFHSAVRAITRTGYTISCVLIGSRKTKTLPRPRKD